MKHPSKQPTVVVRVYVGGKVIEECIKGRLVELPAKGTGK
jgi:hypothetical protein